MKEITKLILIIGFLSVRVLEIADFHDVKCFKQIQSNSKDSAKSECEKNLRGTLKIFVSHSEAEREFKALNVSYLWVGFSGEFKDHSCPHPSPLNTAHPEPGVTNTANSSMHISMLEKISSQTPYSSTVMNVTYTHVFTKEIYKGETIDLNLYIIVPLGLLCLLLCITHLLFRNRKCVKLKQSVDVNIETQTRLQVTQAEETSAPDPLINFDMGTSHPEYSTIDEHVELIRTNGMCESNYLEPNAAAMEHLYKNNSLEMNGMEAAAVHYFELKKIETETPDGYTNDDALHNVSEHTSRHSFSSKEQRGDGQSEYEEIDI